MLRKRTDFLVVHCAATPKHLDVGAEDIRMWHRDQGWSDIGYHFVIRRDGKVESGRPESEVGSGVYGHNYNTLHICLVGGIDRAGKSENNFTSSQFDSLKRLLTEKLKVYPGAKVQGHRDFPGVSKDCPSFDTITWWKEVNSQ